MALVGLQKDCLDEVCSFLPAVDLIHGLGSTSHHFFDAIGSRDTASEELWERLFYRDAAPAAMKQLEFLVETATGRAAEAAASVVGVAGADGGSMLARPLRMLRQLVFCDSWRSGVFPMSPGFGGSSESAAGDEASDGSPSPQRAEAAKRRSYVHQLQSNRQRAFGVVRWPLAYRFMVSTAQAPAPPTFRSRVNAVLCRNVDETPDGENDCDVIEKGIVWDRVVSNLADSLSPAVVSCVERKRDATVVIFAEGDVLESVGSCLASVMSHIDGMERNRPVEKEHTEVSEQTSSIRDTMLFGAYVCTTTHRVLLDVLSPTIADTPGALGENPNLSAHTRVMVGPHTMGDVMMRLRTLRNRSRANEIENLSLNFTFGGARPASLRVAVVPSKRCSDFARYLSNGLSKQSWGAKASFLPASGSRVPLVLYEVLNDLTKANGTHVTCIFQRSSNATSGSGTDAMLMKTVLTA